MKTLDQIRADRAAAGAAYAAAAQAYCDAFQELHAYDQVLSTRSGIAGGGFPAFNVPTPHSEFLREYLHNGLIDRAAARAREITNTLEA